MKALKKNKTEHIDFEGNFGSQDPALQMTAEDTAALSRYFQARKRGFSHEEAVRQADFKDR